MSRLTEVGNAKRLITAHEDDIRYCSPLKEWFTWGGRRWEEDTTKTMHRMAAEVVAKIFSEAEALDSDHPRRAKMLKHAMMSESLKGIQNMVQLAQSADGVSVGIDDFDRDPMLLNVENGTLDLNTGKFGKFNRYDYITKMAPVTYNRNAKAKVWERFLGEVIPDPDTREFLQIAVGYSITSSMAHDKVFILHGRGRNGKTTFVATILNMLGGYGAQAASQVLMSKRAGGPSNDLYVLMGKRFVAASETGDNHRLDENAIKQMSGMDRLSINPKYKSQIEFYPTWKIWLSTNHEPVITGSDLGIWRRLLKIPFGVTITEDNCDPKLKPYLMYNREERSGILNWALEGVRKWKAVGLAIPKSIQDATRYYRADQDLTGQFVEDCCEIHPSLSIPKNKLYRAYTDFCKDINEKPKSIQSFGHQLREREIGDGRKANSRFWVGIDLHKSVSLNPLDYK